MTSHSVLAFVMWVLQDVTLLMPLSMPSPLSIPPYLLLLSVTSHLLPLSMAPATIVSDLQIVRIITSAMATTQRVYFHIPYLLSLSLSLTDLQFFVTEGESNRVWMRDQAWKLSVDKGLGVDERCG